MADGSSSGTPLDAVWRLGLWLAYRVLRIYWFVVRPERRGVFVAVWHRGEVLAIRNSYRDWMTLPAGGMARGETPEETARRELDEEVGIPAPPGSLRFVCEIAARYEWKRDRCTFFELHLEAAPAVRVDRREVVWAGFLTPQALRATHLAPPVRSYLDRVPMGSARSPSARYGGSGTRAPDGA